MSDTERERLAEWLLEMADDVIPQESKDRLHRAAALLREHREPDAWISPNTLEVFRKTPGDTVTVSRMPFSDNGTAVPVYFGAPPSDTEAP